MPPRTPQPPKKNYPGTAALRPDDPNSPQNPAWGLPAGQAQPAGFAPLPPSMEDFPYPGARRYPGGLERYPGPFSDQYPSFPGWDPRMSAAPDPQPSAPIIPRRPGISDTPFNLHSGPDQDYPAERPHRPGLPPIIQDGIDRVRDGIDRARGDAIGAMTDLGGAAVDRIADSPDGAAFLSGVQKRAQALSSSGTSQPTSVAAGPQIDWSFIHDREATPEQARTLTVPPADRNGKVPDANSGVTVAHGFDLGGQDARSLATLGLSPGLVAKLSPFVRVKGVAAQTAINRARASGTLPAFTDAEVAEMDSITSNRRSRELVAEFNAASRIGRFEDLPAKTQTAIASVFFNYAPRTATKIPVFWRQITTGDWQGAYDNLMNFHDPSPSRRRLEGGLIYEDIKSGALASRMSNRR